MENPTFHSPELQKAVDEARPILEGVDEARNRVSEDVKALEAYLQALDLKGSFRYELGKNFISDDPAVGDAIEYGGSVGGSFVEEALVWDEDMTARFRLLYELSRWDGAIRVDEGSRYWDEATRKREAKPLIETKFEVRKRMYQHLPDFVARITEHFSVAQNTGRLSLD